MQSPIHEGYEYQDYFTVSIILQLMLQQIDAELIIDRKDFSGDKFDDLISYGADFCINNFTKFECEKYL